MLTPDILSILEAERDKLNRAIEALQGPIRKRGRPPQNVLLDAQATDVNAKPKRRFTAAVRRKMAAAQRRRWAAVKGQADTPQAPVSVTEAAKKPTKARASKTVRKSARKVSPKATAKVGRKLARKAGKAPRLAQKEAAVETPAQS